MIVQTDQAETDEPLTLEIVFQKPLIDLDLSKEENILFRDTDHAMKQLKALERRSAPLTRKPWWYSEEYCGMIDITGRRYELNILGTYNTIRDAVVQFGKPEINMMVVSRYKHKPKPKNSIGVLTKLDLLAKISSLCSLRDHLKNQIGDIATEKGFLKFSREEKITTVFKQMMDREIDSALVGLSTNTSNMTFVKIDDLHKISDFKGPMEGTIGEFLEEIFPHRSCALMNVDDSLFDALEFMMKNNCHHAWIDSKAVNVTQIYQKLDHSIKVFV